MMMQAKMKNEEKYQQTHITILFKTLKDVIQVRRKKNDGEIKKIFSFLVFFVY
jgi:hypothetical protein